MPKDAYQVSDPSTSKVYGNFTTIRLARASCNFSCHKQGRGTFKTTSEGEVFTQPDGVQLLIKAVVVHDSIHVFDHVEHL